MRCQLTDAGWPRGDRALTLAVRSQVPLTTGAGRARALAAGAALTAALRAEATAPAAWRRLGAVRERLRRLARARDQLAAAVARHVNNLLIHLGNEAAGAALAPPAAPRHHAELLPLAPFMRCLKDMDEKSFEALAKVYTSTWARVYERAVRGASDAARAALGGAGAEGAAGAERLLDGVLALVETLCNAEQDFCTQFFFLDIDVKVPDLILPYVESLRYNVGRCYAGRAVEQEVLHHAAVGLNAAL